MEKDKPYYTLRVWNHILTDEKHLIEVVKHTYGIILVGVQGTGTL